MPKYRFINKKINLTDEQINKHKNFDQLYSAYQSLPTDIVVGIAKVLKILLPLAASVTIIIAAWFMLKPKEDTADQVMAYNTEKPFITSPLPKYDIPFAKYNMNASEGFKLIYDKTGSTVDIPKNAFVNVDGNIVKGEIEIQYREFENPKTFFLAGIPMTYNEAGQQYHFESAGMMEIRAYKDGKPIFLNTKNELVVNMVATQTGDDFKLYFLDEGQKNWVDKGNYEVTKKKTINPITETNFALADNLADDLQEQLEILAPLPVKPTKPLRANDKQYRFTLEYKADEFPELTAYDGITFELEEGQGFKPAYYNITYDKIELKRINNNKYEIILSKGKNKKVFKSYPVFEDSNFEKAQAKFEELDAQYKTAILKRKKEEERLRAKALQERANKKTAILNKGEKKEAYITYLKSLADEQRIYASSINMFSIKKMGIWNCNRKNLFPKGQTLIAQFSDVFGEKLVPERVYLVQEGKNALFTYSKRDFNALKYNPTKRNMLWTVLKDGRLAVFKSSDFNEISIGTNYHKFKLRIYDMATIAKRGIDNLLSFDVNS